MKTFYKNIITILFFLFITNISFAQEKGEYFGTHYPPKLYKGHSQNWCVVQDKRGVMYFGTTTEIIEYDGVNWRKIFSSNHSIIRSLEIDNSGTVYVGCNGDFGYLAPDSTGKMSFVSLTYLIKDKNITFTDVWSVSLCRKDVFFTTRKYIFRYRKETNELKTWQAPKSKRFYYAFSPNIKEISLIGKTNKSGFIIAEDSMINIKGLEEFKHFVRDIVNFKDKSLFVTYSEVFSFNLDIQKKQVKINPFIMDCDNVIKENEPFRAEKVNDSLFLLSTIKDGAFMITKTGKLIKHINNKNFLFDRKILNIYTGENQASWLAMNQGITKYEIKSPFTIWNYYTGFEHSLNRILKNKNEIYAASGNGLYYLDLSNEKQNNFEKLPEIPNAWALTKIPEENKVKGIIVGSAGVFLLKNKKVKKISRTSRTAFGLLFSKFNPERLYISGTNYIYSVIIKSENDIKIEKEIEIKGNARYLTEDKNGNLWVGTDYKGLIKISFDKNNKTDNFFKNNILKSNFDINYYNSVPELEKKQFFFITQMDNKIVVPADKGFIKYDENLDKFVKDKDYPKFLDSLETEKIYKDNSGKYWLLTKKGIMSFVKKADNTFKTDTSIFKRINDISFYDINPYDRNFAFFVGPGGIVKFDKNNYQNFYESKFNTLIRKVKITGDSVIFFGTNFNSENSETKISLSNKTEFPTAINYEQNSIVFDFAAPFFIEESKTKYSYILENFDKNFSEWSSKTEKEYTNLREGKYIFKVKAKNIFDIESEFASFEFKILPPWYRTFYAYFVYVILLIFLVWLILKLNSNRLVKKQIHLEGIVKQRTTEIQQQKEEIQTQADNLEDINSELNQQKKEIQKQADNLKEVNIELHQQKEEIQTQSNNLKEAYEKISFKNEQITASVRYASTIQTAMLPFENAINKLFENFVIFRPKNIVSGDFHWMGNLKDKKKKLITVVDCTGHGVPGAFMSMIGIRILDMIVFERKITEPAEILKLANILVIKALHQNTSTNNDGMDMCLISVEKAENDFKVKFAGAKLPLFYKNDKTGKIIRIRGTRKSIGGYRAKRITDFEQHEFILKKNTVLYLTTDGYIDQNGQNTKRMGTPAFEQALAKINNLSLSKQKEYLENMLDKHQGNYDQRDDITVLGIKL